MKRQIFLKGLLMGICDTVPGISGGTIAFITGIYERLINALKGFSLPFFYNALLFILGKGDRSRLKKDFRKLDLGFLITLFAGIVVAILIFSRVISFLLENYFTFTMAFFVGLILASARSIFGHIEKHHSLNMVLAVVGLVLGISLAFLVPANVTPSLGYILFGGFLAVSAMILPGISGSFILLIMGVYGFMLNVVKDLFNNLDYVFVFVVGAIIGLFTISRIISFLLRKDKSATLYFLLGLVVGSLSVPVRNIYANGLSFGFVDWIFIILLLVLGVVAASSVSHFSKNKYLVKS